jgi:aminoglycoside 6'-N-acetyltransferase I
MFGTGTNASRDGMTASIAVRDADGDSPGPALHLLRCFFAEEGFATPPENMRAALRTMLNDEGSAVLLASRGGEAVGVATVTTSVGLEYGLSAELEDLYVLPGERGRGVASMLVEAVCAWCCERRVSVLLATVTPGGEERHGLTDFYRHRGFAAAGRTILERDLVASDLRSVRDG